MRTHAILIGAVTLLFGAVLANGAPLDPTKRGFEIKLEGFGKKESWRLFAGGKRALAVALGSNQTNLGLYVFDAHGNCVGHDDRMTQLSRDDLMVEWLPAQRGLFSIEVKSLARKGNEVLLVVRQD